MKQEQDSLLEKEGSMKIDQNLTVSYEEQKAQWQERKKQQQKEKFLKQQYFLLCICWSLRSVHLQPEMSGSSGCTIAGSLHSRCVSWYEIWQMKTNGISGITCAVEQMLYLEQLADVLFAFAHVDAAPVIAEYLKDHPDI